MQLFCPAVPVVHDRIVRDGSQDCSHGSTDMIRSMRGVLREAHAFLFAPRCVPQADRHRHRAVGGTRPGALRERILLEAKAFT
jgi:hypothetical protein